RIAAVRIRKSCGYIAKGRSGCARAVKCAARLPDEIAHVERVLGRLPVERDGDTSCLGINRVEERCGVLFAGYAAAVDAGKASFLDLPAKAVLEVALVCVVVDRSGTVDDGDNIQSRNEQ